MHTYLIRAFGWLCVAAAVFAGGFIAGGRLNDGDKCTCRVQFFADYIAKMDDLDRRERQLRAFVVGRAVPQRMPDRVEDPRLLGEWHLNAETLAWERHSFGVDRSKLSQGEVRP